MGVDSYGIAGLLLASEQIPSILAIFMGFIADVIGRRKLLLLGLLKLPIITLIGVVNPIHIPVIAAMNALLNSIIAPAGIGVILNVSNRSGRTYSLLAMSSALGWIVGGIIPGLINDYVEPVGVFFIAGLFASIASIIQYLFYPSRTSSTDAKISPSQLCTAFANVWRIALSVVTANAALSLFYTIVALKVYSNIKNLLIYGLALSTSTALANAFTRPVAGKLVDKYNPLIVLASSLIAYLVLDTGIFLATGMILLILWVIPIYPFRDTATLIAISRRIPLELQSTAVGITLTMTSLSGLLVLVLSWITGGRLEIIYFTHILFILVSLIMVLIQFKLEE